MWRRCSCCSCCSCLCYWPVAVGCWWCWYCSPRHRRALLPFSVRCRCRCRWLHRWHRRRGRGGRGSRGCHGGDAKHARGGLLLQTVQQRGQGLCAREQERQREAADGERVEVVLDAEPCGVGWGGV